MTLRSTNDIKVGVVGGTGYTGVELLRLLAYHRHVCLHTISSRSHCGERVCDLFPTLRGVTELSYEEPTLDRLSECDVVFFATPNGVAMEHAPELLGAGVRVIDLSADFRLKKREEWEAWYGRAHACPELLPGAVYGLPEVAREEIRQARLVANPGCYPTAIQLGFLPLVERALVDPSRLIADAKSGVSGAGRKEAIATQLCEAGESLKAYSVSGHRHLPEIVQGLEKAAKGPVGLTFVPHLTPMIRGIHATLYATLLDPGADVQAAFEARYEDEPFVDVLPAGSHPETRNVRGSNVCQISWHRPRQGDTVVVLAVEDNLTKGAAGQAIQNMNIMLALDEREGLIHPGMVP